jgi:hypothetical protein
LAAHGVNVVIYANQLLRSAYPAMRRTLETILFNNRAFEADKLCLSINEIINLIPVGGASVDAPVSSVQPKPEK